MISNDTVTSAVMSCVPGSTGVESAFAATGVAAAHIGCGVGAVLGDREDRAHGEAAGVREGLCLRPRVGDRLLERLAVERVAIGGRRGSVRRPCSRRPPTAASMSAPAFATAVLALTEFWAV